MKKKIFTGLATFLATQQAVSSSGEVAINILGYLNNTPETNRRELAESLLINPNGIAMTARSTDDQNGKVYLEAYDDDVSFPFDDGKGLINIFSISGENSSLAFDSENNQLGLLFDTPEERMVVNFGFDLVNNKFVLDAKEKTTTPSTETKSPTLFIDPETGVPSKAPSPSSSQPSLRPTVIYAPSTHPITKKPTLVPTFLETKKPAANSPTYEVGGSTENPTLTPINSQTGQPNGPIAETKSPTTEGKPDDSWLVYLALLAISLVVYGGYRAVKKCRDNEKPQGTVTSPNPTQLDNERAGGRE